MLKELYISNNMINDLKFAKDITVSNSNIEFAPGINLKFGSVHEICGSSNFIMAMMIASKIDNLIIWIHEDNRIPFPDGVSSWVSPNKIILIKVSSTQELLWSIEESLRVGIGFLVIGNSANIPSFTSIRRLKLIIKNHYTPSQKSLPTVLILTNHDCKLIEGVESRWHCSPMKDTYTKKKNKIINAWKLICQYSKHEMRKTWVVNEFEDLEDPFSFFKKKKNLTLISKKILE